MYKSVRSSTACQGQGSTGHAGGLTRGLYSVLSCLMKVRGVSCVVLTLLPYPSLSLFSVRVLKLGYPLRVVKSDAVFAPRPIQIRRVGFLMICCRERLSRETAEKQEGPASCWAGCHESPTQSRLQLFQSNGTCAAKCRRKCLILDWGLAADGVIILSTSTSLSKQHFSPESAPSANDRLDLVMTYYSAFLLCSVSIFAAARTHRRFSVVVL
ncbi:hypothetical protein V8C26DRAFT_206563 [Trichoderma gracile]